MTERREYDNDNPVTADIVSWQRYEYDGLNLLRIDALYDGDDDGDFDSTDEAEKSRGRRSSRF